MTGANSERHFDRADPETGKQRLLVALEEGHLKAADLPASVDVQHASRVSDFDDRRDDRKPDRDPHREHRHQAMVVDGSGSSITED